MVAKEDISFMMPNYKKAEVGIPMVCFTDIPIELTKEHRRQYGEYGIGLKKEWGINKGLNPICYIIKDSEMYNAYNYLQWIIQQNAFKLDNGKKDGENTLITMNAVMDFAGHLKEYSDDPELNSKPFYDEREWRYLPPFKDEEESIYGYCNRLFDGAEADEREKEKLNQHMKQKYTLEFTVDDVDKIVLPHGETESLIRLLYSSKLSDVELYIKKLL
jgi:Protein of unknown function (DUF2743).